MRKNIIEGERMMNKLVIKKITFFILFFLFVLVSGCANEKLIEVRRYAEEYIKYTINNTIDEEGGSASISHFLHPDFNFPGGDSLRIAITKGYEIKSINKGVKNKNISFENHSEKDVVEVEVEYRIVGWIRGEKEGASFSKTPKAVTQFLYISDSTGKPLLLYETRIDTDFAVYGDVVAWLEYISEKISYYSEVYKKVKSLKE